MISILKNKQKIYKGEHSILISLRVIPILRSLKSTLLDTPRPNEQRVMKGSE